MPLILDVLTHIDERSAALSARQLEREFEVVGHEAGTSFADNMAQGMIAGFHRADFDSILGFMSTGAMAAEATTHGSVLGAAFAAGIVGAASVALVDLGVEVGDTFEGINRQITLHTAASGKALADMATQADRLAGSLDSSTANLGADFATLGQRLQMSGGQLDTMTQHVEMLRDRMGNFNIGALTGAFSELGVGANQADGALASVTAAAQRLDMPLPDLVNNLAQFATTFKDMHLSVGQSAELLGEVSAKGVPVAAAMTGMEMAMKAANTQGVDLATMLRNAAYSIEEYRRRGDELSAEQVSLDVFGTRKWEQAEVAAASYQEVLRNGAGAYAENGQYLDDLGQKTADLHNRWERVENQVKAALAPVALNVVDDIGDKMQGFTAFLSAHQQDLAQFFGTAISTIETVVEDVGKLAAVLGEHPALIQAVALAFAAWESIKGVDFVLTGVEALGAWFVGAPAAAATAAAGVSAAEADMVAASTAAGGDMALAFGPVMGELAEMPAEAETAATAIVTSMTDADAAVIALGGAIDGAVASMAAFAVAAAPFLAVAAGVAGLMAVATATGSATGQEDTPDYTKGGQVALGADGKPLLGPDGKPITAGMGHAAAGPKPTGVFADGTTGDPVTRAGTGLPDAPVSADPSGGAAGAPTLLTPQMLDPGHVAGLPKAPEVPMPAGYGATPRPGETAEQYDAEQRVLEQQHGVDEAKARLNQLEADNNATADDITKARNDVITAQKNQNAAELQLYQTQTQQMGRYGDQMQTLGAEIDKDFGISKGLPGIADNITKFLGNLMLAGPLAALNQIVDQSGVRQNAQGAGGLIGMGAVSGAFGPSFQPQAAGGTLGAESGGAAFKGPGSFLENLLGGGNTGRGAAGGGVPQGPFGGYPGAKGAAASFTSPPMPSISSPGDVAAAGTSVAALYQFAESMEGTPYSMQLRNDCSGMVSRIASEAVGLGDPGAGQRFSTANEGQWLSSHGFQSGMGGPNDLNIGWHIGGPAGGHTAATLPGGVNAEQGGGTPGDSFTLGPQAAGAANPEFEYHAHLPMGATQPQWGPRDTMNTDASGAVTSPSGYQTGARGNVPGGPKGSDTVPAWLTPGEEVAQTSAVRKYGASTYAAMNQGLVDPTSIRYLAGGGSDDSSQGEATHIGGDAPNAGYGSGVGGGGPAAGAVAGAIGGAAPSAGSGAGAVAPMGGAAAGAGAGAATLGIGLAAQIAAEEAQRAVQYVGALAGIGAEGLMETFLPTGGSQLAQNSWLTKIAGGLMGAQPQIPNTAGKSQNASPQGVSGMGPGGAMPSMPGPQPAGMPPAAPTPVSVMPPAGPAAPPQGAAHAQGTQGGKPPMAGPTPESVIGAGAGQDGAAASLYGAPGGNQTGIGPGAPSGWNNTGGAAPAVHIENYHAHDDPNSAGQDIARHTVAANAPSRGTSQWA